MKKVLALVILSLSFTVLAESNTSSLSLADYNFPPQVLKERQMVSMTLGALGESASFGSNTPTISFSYDYQVLANIWAEFSVGLTTITGFPANDIDTQLYSYSLKAKFSLIGPWKSVIFPYLGLKYNSPYSPGAGVNASSDQEKIEVALLDELKELKPVFGFTVVRPFAKGWYGRVDLGVDVAAAGVTATF